MMIQLKRNNTKNTAIKAGIAGAVIGAAGTAIGIAMSDKKNREMVKGKLSDAKDWTKDKVSEMKSDTKDASRGLKKQAGDAANELRADTKSAIKKTADK